MSRYSAKILFQTHNSAYDNQANEQRRLGILLKKVLTDFHRTLQETPIEFESMHDLAEELSNRFMKGNLQILLNQNPVFVQKTLQEDVLNNKLQFDTPEPFDTICNWVRQGLLIELALPQEPSQPVIVPDAYYGTSDFREIMSDLVNHNVGWRLFVDGTKQRSETAASYDQREPGCLLAMARSFHHAMENLDTSPTFNQIVEFHTLCIAGVKKLNEDPLSKEPYRMSEDIVGFGITNSGQEPTQTLNGYRELCLHSGIDKDYTVRCNRVQTVLYGDELASRIDQILTEYERNMSLASTKEQKLHLIVENIAHLERIHPFWDANCRTLCIMVLNKELIRHGFSPVILEDPNRFDCFSTNELMNEVIIGFSNYEYVKIYGQLPEENSISKSHVRESVELVHAIEDELKNLKPGSRYGM
ncbi:MAG: hypothetical protein AB7D28_04535 [Candidatus Berkiella sp.]